MVQNFSGFGSHLLPEFRRVEDLDAGTEAENPADELPGRGDFEPKAQAAILLKGRLLTRVPDAVPCACRGGLVEEQFHADRLSAHDLEGIPDVGLQVEVERQLVGVVGDGEGSDALDGEQPHLVPEVAVPDEIEPPCAYQSRYGSTSRRVVAFREAE